MQILLFRCGEALIVVDFVVKLHMNVFIMFLLAAVKASASHAPRQLSS